MSTILQTIEQIQEVLRQAATTLSEMAKEDNEGFVTKTDDLLMMDIDLPVSDILIQVNPNTGEMIVSNEDEVELSKGVITDWIEQEEDTFYTQIQPPIKKAIDTIKCEMHNLKVSKPYTFVLIDMQKETIADLYLVDDHNIQIEDELMSGLEEDLNEFWKKLSEEN